MMELFGVAVVELGLFIIACLVIFFCWAAGKLAEEEAERARLRRQTRNAMLTDRHMQRLRQNKMHAQYVRRVRVW